MVDLIQRAIGPDIAVETRTAPDLWAALLDPSLLQMRPETESR
ncbi:hypothetical protein [Sphingomonas endolithica]|nr:hypothetical protein [Sphingomonas sp. ZFBP2030]